MNRLQVSVLAIAAVVTSAAAAVLPGTNVSAANTPSWKPIGKATSGFSTAVMRWDHAKAKQYLTSSLRKQADVSSVHQMLGIQVTPYRFWYWVDRFDGRQAQVSLTHSFPNARKAVTNHLSWMKVGPHWKISKIVRGATPASDSAWRTVAVATEDLGFAVLRGNNTAINRHAAADLLKAAPAGQLVNILGMQNLPGRFAYTVDSVRGPYATATMTWIFGRSTVVDRLRWVSTNAGWRIADVKIVFG